MLNSEEFKTLARQYGRQIDTSDPGELANKMQQLNAVRKNLRPMFDKLQSGETRPATKLSNPGKAQ